MARFSHGARELFLKDEQASAGADPSTTEEEQQGETETTESKETDKAGGQEQVQGEERWLLPSLKYSTPKKPTKKVSGLANLLKLPLHYKGLTFIYIYLHSLLKG